MDNTTRLLKCLIALFSESNQHKLWLAINIHFAVFYSQLMEMEADRDRVNQRLQMLQKSLGEAEEGKRGAHGRLASAQTALMLQEETIRRNEREQKSMAEKLAQLERSNQSSETERRGLQVSIWSELIVWSRSIWSIWTIKCRDNR